MTALSLRDVDLFGVWHQMATRWVLQNLAACHVEETQTASESGWQQQGSLRRSRNNVFLSREVTPLEWKFSPSTENLIDLEKAQIFELRGLWKMATSPHCLRAEAAVMVYALAKGY